MSIKVQRVIRFIPGVNLVSLVAWIVAGARKNMRVSYFIKHLLLMLALILFAVMIGRGLSTFSANEVFSSVLFYLSLVLYTYICSFISVSEQENLINGKYESKEL